jgi:hypothetical protein
VNVPVDAPEIPPSAADAAAPAESPEDASLRKIAHEAIDYVRHLVQLFLGEVQIARGSFVRMLVAGALIPVFLMTIWAALNLLLAALVTRWLGNWNYGYLSILVVNAVLVGILVVGLLRWKRDLTLPRSREALARLLERIR